MTALHLKLWMTTVFVMLLVAVPALVANHALQVIHAQTERAEASAQTLSSYQRLAVLGYTLLQERYVNPQAFDKNRSMYRDGVRSHVANTNHYIDAEIRLIGAMSLHKSRRAAKIAEEFQQREKLTAVGARLESALSENRNADWETPLFEIIKDEERETREYQRGSIETFGAMTETFTWMVVIVSIFGVLAIVWTQRQIIRPLGNLQRGTLAISQGDYAEQVPVVGTTEFRTIAESFNTMASRVGEASRSLQQTNANLERAVARRTAELAATNRSLTRANELRRQFLADASHELRTPLSIMRSEAEITLRKAEANTDDLRTGLHRVIRLTALMADMIDDMLQVARAEEPMLHSTIAPLDVVAAVGNCIDDFRRLIEADGGRIALVRSPEHLMIESDETRLKQVIRIIVDNAVCYSSQAPVIEVGICEEQGTALIIIADKGDGIPAAEIPLIFQRFRRGARNSGTGQGLGLSIARSITEALGGTIGLESRLQEGTTVSIRLPLLGATEASILPNLQDKTDGKTS